MSVAVAALKKVSSSKRRSATIWPGSSTRLPLTPVFCQRDHLFDVGGGQFPKVSADALIKTADQSFGKRAEGVEDVGVSGNGLSGCRLSGVDRMQKVVREDVCGVACCASNDGGEAAFDECVPEGAFFAGEARERCQMLDNRGRKIFFDQRQQVARTRARVRCVSAFVASSRHGWLIA